MHDSSTNTVSRLKGSYNLFSPCRTSYNRTLFQVLFPDRLLIDGEAQYLASIAELDKIWEELPGVVTHGSRPYPLSVSLRQRELRERLMPKERLKA